MACFLKDVCKSHQPSMLLGSDGTGTGAAPAGTMGLGLRARRPTHNGASDKGPTAALGVLPCTTACIASATTGTGAMGPNTASG